jgi:hypothetical protein
MRFVNVVSSGLKFLPTTDFGIHSTTRGVRRLGRRQNLRTQNLFQFSDRLSAEFLQNIVQTTFRRFDFDPVFFLRRRLVRRA